MINNCSVDIFFVLSGFLITKKLDYLISKKNYEEKFKELKKYFLNRFFKIIPPYYAIIIICLLLSKYGFYNANDFDFSFFLFSQSFKNAEFYFIPQSYSLVIEVWFYLIFPLLLLLFLLISKKINVLVSSSILVIIFCIIYRYYNNYFVIENWDGQVRKAMLSRLDSPFYGVLLYYLNQRFRVVFKKYKILIKIVGFVILITCSFILISKNNILFNNVFYFTVYPLSLLTVVNFFFHIKIPNRFYNLLRLKSNQVYSLYLVHLPVLYILADKLTANNKFEAILNLIIGVISSYFVSIILYNLVEKPFQKFKI